MPNKYSYVVPENLRHAVVIPIDITVPLKMRNAPNVAKLGVKLNALIDTGASNSCISKGYADSCNLPIR